MAKVMIFNAIFNNISVIPWRTVLLVEETGVPRENHRPVTSHWQNVSHNVVSWFIYNKHFDKSSKLISRILFSYMYSTTLIAATIW